MDVTVKCVWRRRPYAHPTAPCRVLHGTRVSRVALYRLRLRFCGNRHRYIDPSYLIRSVPANADDSELCMLLTEAAVHGAMAGFVHR